MKISRFAGERPGQDGVGKEVEVALQSLIHWDSNSDTSLIRILIQQQRPFFGPETLLLRR